MRMPVLPYANGSRSILPPEVPQFFVPLRSSKPAAAALVYKPQVLGCAQIYYSDPKSGVDLTVDYSYLVDVTDDAVAVNWPDAEREDLADTDLDYAVRIANYSSFFHQGQMCMNTRKVYIERPLYEEFVALLKQRGLPVVETNRELGQLFVQDPDGNVIELIRPR